MDDLSFTSILIRVSIMYVVGLVLMRISGKQSIGQLSTMDFVVMTILGDGFDTIIYGEAPVIQGLVYFVTLVAVHLLVSLFSSRSLLVYRLVNSPPTTIIQNGIYVQKGLQAERIRVDNVQSEMRQHGEDQLSEVKDARLEPDGRLSLLKNHPSKPVQKQDRKLLPRS